MRLYQSDHHAAQPRGNNVYIRVPFYLHGLTQKITAMLLLFVYAGMIDCAGRGLFY